MDFSHVLDHLFAAEGGLVDDPDDLGGLTKFGITERDHPDVDIARLTAAGAATLYRERYWDEYRAGELPARLRYLYFDGCVNQGPGVTIGILQKLAGVPRDGLIGPRTIAAAVAVSAEDFAEGRRARYEYILRKRERSRKYRRGWMRRLWSAVAFNALYAASLEREVAAPTCPQAACAKTCGQ